MAFTPMNPGQGYPAIGAVVTSGAYTDKVPLGTIITAVDPDLGAGEFIYLQGLASTVRGNVVKYNSSDFTTKRAVADDAGPIAIAMAATVASTKGWYQIQGKGVATVATAFADNGNCYLTATPGVIDDEVVAGDLVHNMLGASAINTPSTGLAYVEMSRPWTDNNVDDLDVS